METSADLEASSCVSTLGQSNITSGSTMLEPEDDKSNLQEYETQYFGFTPKAFSNGVYNAALEYIQKVLAEMENYINQEFGKLMNPSQVKEGKDIVLTSMITKLDCTFDLLDAYLMKNVFYIPDHVILPEDMEQKQANITLQREEELNEEINQLKNKILAYKSANNVMREELTKYDKVQCYFDTALDQLQKMDSLISTQGGVAGLKDCLLLTTGKVKDMMEKVKAMQGTMGSPNSLETFNTS